MATAAKPVQDAPGQKKLFAEGATEQEKKRDAIDVVASVVCGVTLRTTRIGTQKSASQEDISEATETLGGEADALSISKRLISSRHPDVQSVSLVFAEAKNFWLQMTLPLASHNNGTIALPGQRVIPQHLVKTFETNMVEIAKRLETRALAMEKAMPEIKEEARQRLGERLYDPNDYPDKIAHRLKIDWTYFALSVPNILENAWPELFESQRDLRAAQIANTLRLGRGAFLSTFKAHVDHIVERLTGVAELRSNYTGTITDINVDEGYMVVEVKSGNRTVEKRQKLSERWEFMVSTGQAIKKDEVVGIDAQRRPKVFRDSAVGHLSDAINYFRNLGEIMQAPATMESLVHQASQLLLQGLGQAVARSVEGKELSAANIHQISQELRQMGNLRTVVRDNFLKLSELADVELQAYPSRVVMRENDAGDSAA